MHSQPKIFRYKFNMFRQKFDLFDILQRFIVGQFKEFTLLCTWKKFAKDTRQWKYINGELLISTLHIHSFSPKVWYLHSFLPVVWLASRLSEGPMQTPKQKRNMYNKIYKIILLYITTELWKRTSHLHKLNLAFALLKHSTQEL